MTAPLSVETNFEDLWTIAQAMKFLGVKKTWLYEACSRSEVPHVRLGSSIRFVPEVLRKWVLTTASRGPGSPSSAPVLLMGAKR